MPPLSSETVAPLTPPVKKRSTIVLQPTRDAVRMPATTEGVSPILALPVLQVSPMICRPGRASNLLTTQSKPENNDGL